MLRPTRTFTDIQVICKKTRENNKVSGHMMLLAQVSDYFNTLFNTRLGTFNGITELECTAEAFTFITDCIIYTTDVIAETAETSETPEMETKTKTETSEPQFLAVEVLELMDILQIKPKFQELVVKELLDDNIDFSKHPEIYEAYMEFIIQFPQLLTDDIILKYSINSNETFLRTLFALPNLRQWYGRSSMFVPGVVLKIVKEKPDIIVKIMSAGLAIFPVVEILSSQAEVEMFYEYFLRYLATCYIKSDFGYDYSGSYLKLIEKNKQFGNVKNIELILTKLIRK